MQSEPENGISLDPTAEMTVLIVEDDPAFAELQRYLLAHAGFSVRVAPGVQEAVESLKNQPCDAVVLDFSLPDGSPWSVVEAAISHAPEIPVLMATAAGSEQIAAEATRRGVQQYAIKGEDFCRRLPDTIRDLVASNRVRQRMRRASAVLDLIDRHTSNVITISALTGEILYISSSALKVFGYGSADLRGRLYFQLVHPEDRPIVERFFELIGQDGQAAMCFRYLRRDGSIGWVETSGTLFGNEDAGNQLQVIAISREVTARKQVEESLHQRERELLDSEDRYRRLVESIDDYGILMLDAAGCVASWTTAAAKIKGYAPEEILGKHFSCFYTREDQERGHPAEVLRIAASEGSFTEECLGVRKDGSTFWAAVSITAIRGDAGDLRGFSIVTRNITRQVESEMKIRQDEEMFRALLESAPDAVVIADEAGKICRVNAQAERLFGYRRDEMEGQRVELLIPASLRSRHAANRQAYHAEARVRRMGAGMELKGLRKAGDEFPVEINLSPNKTSTGSWVAAAIRDTTERKFAEEQLIIARRRAEEASQAKSDFLAAVSHEIRTPMNAILGMSELLSETELTADQRKFVTVFRRAGSSLMTLINDILDLSKIEAGQLELETTEFDPRELLVQIVDLTDPKAQAKGLSLRTEISPEIPLLLCGDPGRLRQVLLNLLGNALKFTHSGEVVLAASATGDGIEFAVSDTGIGIAEDQLGVIFEDFKQGDASITRKYGGTGLGLGISRRLVERMGGTLAVTSVLGQGSTFRFNLPLTRVLQETAVESPFVGGFRDHGIALIDPDNAGRKMMRQTLASWGFKVDEYSTCDDVLTALANGAFEERNYSLAIVDRQMPMMDGFALAKHIHDAVADLPVVMLTSNEIPGDEARRKASCLRSYAVRPLSRTEFLQLVIESVRRSPCDPESLDGATKDPPGALRILIAEDSPDNRLLMELYLENTPHRLTFVANGQQAVEAAERGVFDLVLMDLQMPVMDGLTATRQIRAREHSQGARRLPIVALSANARWQDIRLSTESGCDAHLSKPISKRRLLGVLDQYSTEPSPAGEAAALSPALAARVPGYLESRRQEAISLREMLAARDFEAIYRIAHQAKGTGTSYGFPGLTRIAAMLQDHAERRDADALRESIAEFDRFVSAARESVNAGARPPVRNARRPALRAE